MSEGRKAQITEPVTPYWCPHCKESHFLLDWEEIICFVCGTNLLYFSELRGEL